MASDIRIVGMNGNSVDPIPNTKLYRYSFRLSETPEYDWKLIYEQTVKGGLVNALRRRSTIAGDTIIVEMSADDDKQQQLDLQKELVAEVNRKYDTAQDLVARELEAKAKQKQSDEDEIQRLREEAKALKF
jgi:hypothetical protein